MHQLKGKEKGRLLYINLCLKRVLMLLLVNPYFFHFTFNIITDVFEQMYIIYSPARVVSVRSVHQ